METTLLIPAESASIFLANEENEPAGNQGKSSKSGQYIEMECRMRHCAIRGFELTAAFNEMDQAQ